MYLEGSSVAVASVNGSDVSRDMSKTDAIEKENVLWILVDCFLFVTIALGNILTILAIAVTRRLRSVVSNYFVLNLAVSDLLVGIALPYHLAFYVNDTWSHNETICISRFVIISVACGGSIYNIMVIAIDRYIAIVHPLSYSAYATRRRVLLIIAATWISTISIASIPTYWNHFNVSSTCEFETVLPRNYITAIQIPSFFLTWTTIFLMYWKIWREAKMCARRMNFNIISNIAEKNDHKSVQVVLLIVGCFTLCWLPYFVVACMRSFDWMLDSTVIWYKVTFALALANSGMNPLIYAWKNTNFRRAFQKILRLKSPNNKLNSSLKMYLEQQHNELRSKQKDTEHDHGINGSNSLRGYPSDQQFHHAEETRVENTIL